ncbi:hypothetical protein VSAK1_10368 [Vibrio mediterranei AK1]|uniref:Integrase n=2 Tax=Vibrio mediterranei TaxID=689 RepID=A0ABX5DMS7_9VIBR|nr:hypothetical protein [Vibrio mediterranei]EDL53834.1 hypothetical protein VSAK1_10368 [Vibrio mediterranei AK1]PCD90175.1 hypothetical protein COR52_02615 [Vibrio mediterranei]PRQ69561.1 hypothetical protein COR51_02910 [Vibrio mediterranei]
MTIMASYQKPGIAFRRKQVTRLLAILEDIFQHEPYLGEQLHKVGKRQIIGYWQRTRHESTQTRKEKYAILKLFFEQAHLRGRVPFPKLDL